jgi:hypothetical protein
LMDGSFTAPRRLSGEVARRKELEQFCRCRGLKSESTA